MPGEDELWARVRARLPGLSGGHRQVAEYVLKNSEKAAFMTAAALSQVVGVSESTVVRLATALGYSGYPELQRALQEVIKQRLTTVDRLWGSAAAGEQGILYNVMNTDMENIRLTLRDLDEAAFERAVDAILAARQIAVVGVRSGASLAWFLGFNLSWVLNNVRVVGSGPLDMWEQIATLEPADLVIAISFPRYSRPTVRALDLARKRGVKTIAITDTIMSPLAQRADITLTARGNIASFVDSFVAPLSLANALLTAVSVRDKDRTARALAGLEEIWEREGIYYQE